MSFNQAILVRQVRDVLGEDIKWRTLATAANAADTSIDVTDGTDWNEGDILEWESDGDQCYVQSVSSNTLTVIRSVNGTTAAAHAGTAATKNPVYPYIKVADALDATIMGLWPWAWGVSYATVTPVSGTEFYEVANTTLDIIDLVKVEQEGGATAGSHLASEPIYQYQTPDGLRCKLRPRQLELDWVSASPWVLEFPDGFYNTTHDIRAYFRHKLRTTQSGGDYIDLNPFNDDTASSINDVIIWGAAARLLKMQPAARLRNDGRQWNNSVELSDIGSMADFYYQEYRRLLMNNYDWLMRTAAPMGQYSAPLKSHKP